MNLVDTHAHLQFKAYDEDRNYVVKRSSEQLAALVNVGTSVESSKNGVELSKKVEGFFSSVGVHPHHAGLWNDETIPTFESLLKEEKVVAVGEIGLDNHSYQDYPQPDLKAQTEILHKQIDLAVKNKKPVLFHCRDAYDEIYEEIKQYNGKISGLMHCYMGTWGQAKNFLDLGLYISFSGNITYKRNDYIRRVAKKIPKEKILIETDAPFLPPEPYRGQRNEPIYVKIAAETLSFLKGWFLGETAAITSKNAAALLKISL